MGGGGEYRSRTKELVPMPTARLQHFGYLMTNITNVSRKVAVYWGAL